ncbi:MAG: tRNA (guanosine(37)-N1)-methyltransferase TrmD [Holophagales bacterium]|jgi:tRNA (guanine37-N1)-methyltransferase|nr:tRNA (guanosine(37)-N1)-methyltransferase TrmD [Holophagales bacterium]
MQFDVLTLFPEFFDAARLGVTGRAFRELGHQLNIYNFRAFADNVHAHVDDAPFGGGPGMVLCPDVLRDALKSVSVFEPRKIIHFSPAAPPLTHKKVLELIGFSQLILICTRYEGADQRAIELYVDEEISIGEAVVSGGELPALFLIDAVCRWLPGVLGNNESAERDSFANGLLDYPHYTRPEMFEGIDVPKVLRCGNHSAVALWRLRESMIRTKKMRPDLWNLFLRDRVNELSSSEQWAAWQAEHPEDCDKDKPKGWKGFV